MTLIKEFISFFTLILLSERGSLMTGGEEGGGDAPEGESSGVPPEDDSGEGNSPETQINWPEGLDPTLKGNETLTSHYNKDKGEFDMPGIMRSLVHNKSMVGAEKIAKPQKNWDENKYHDFYKQIGLPDSVDQYEFEVRGLPEGQEPDNKFVGDFKEKAYEAGILPKQAEKLVEWFNQTNSSKQQDVQLQMRNEFEQDRLELQKEYGNSLEGKLKQGFDTLKLFASDDEIATMKKKGLLDEPDVSRLLIKITENLNDDHFESNLLDQSGMTPAQADQRLKEMSKQEVKLMSPKEKKIWSEEWSRLAAVKNSVSNGQNGGRSAKM